MSKLAVTALTREHALFFAYEVLGHENEPGGFVAGYDRGARRIAECAARVMADWITVEKKQLKSGKIKTTVIYLDGEAAEKRMWDYLKAGKTPEELLQRALHIYAAAALFKRECGADGKTPYPHLPGNPTARKALTAITKPIVPMSVKRIDRQVREYDAIEQAQQMIQQAKEEKAKADDARAKATQATRRARSTSSSSSPASRSPSSPRSWASSRTTSTGRSRRSNKTASSPRRAVAGIPSRPDVVVGRSGRRSRASTGCLTQSERPHRGSCSSAARHIYLSATRAQDEPGVAQVQLPTTRRTMSKKDSDTSSGRAAGAQKADPCAERTWTTVGAKYTTPERCPDVLRAIASLQWHEVGDGDLELPALPGLAIKACIRQLSLPRVSQVAWNGAAASVDWYDPKRREGEHYSIYGIEMNYDNGRARLYVIDTGTGAVPLASDFWPDTAASTRAA